MPSIRSQNVQITRTADVFILAALQGEKRDVTIGVSTETDSIRETFDFF